MDIEHFHQFKKGFFTVCFEKAVFPQQKGAMYVRYPFPPSFGLVFLTSYKILRVVHENAKVRP